MGWWAIVFKLLFYTWSTTVFSMAPVAAKLGKLTSFYWSNWEFSYQK